MSQIQFESWGVPKISPEMKDRVAQSYKTLSEGTGLGANALGWHSLPTGYDRDEYARIKEVSARVRADADVFITIGIGGSYLGARAVIHALSGSFARVGEELEDGGPEMLYAGHHLSGSYMRELLNLIANKSVYLNVISKSGTTLEPALAFRVLRSALEERYGMDEARDRIFATTDATDGALKRLSDEKGYETFIVPDDIGGRYSVLTAVGLLPIAVAGIDTDALLAGAAEAQEMYAYDASENACSGYVATRNALYEDGISTEIFVSYDPALQYFAEWWKQLFGESEGKGNKGLYPSSVQYTSDLHSLGQYVQSGQRNLCETVITIADQGMGITVSEDEKNYDGLNYLAGKTFADANDAARIGTREAHLEGGVPQMSLTIPRLDAHSIGHLIYFFEKSCGVSAYTLGVNPFDQPGVEAYKQKMFALLGRPS